MPIQKISKEEIIQKAFEIFIAKGYHDTSIADIAQACDIKKPLLYYYFEKGKEQLMEEVLNFTKNNMLYKLRKLVENEELSPKEKLISIAQYTEKIFSKYPGGCIMANTTMSLVLLETAFSNIIRAFFNSWIASLKLIYMAKYQEEKALELAEASVQDIEGGIMLMKIYQDKKYLLNALRRLEKQLD